MAKIDELLNTIATGVYGRDVRGAIHDAIEQAYDDATGNPDSIAAYAKQVEELNARLDDDEKIFSDLSNNFVTGADYARIGNMAFCRGYLVFRNQDVNTESGNVYVGTATYNDSGKVLETGMELQAAFPVCFTSHVSCVVINHGLREHLTISRVVADNGGISEVSFLSGKSHTGTSVPVRYIAVGRIDGDRALGARVVTQALSHLNCPEYYDTGKTWAEYFIDRYNEIPAVVAAGNTQAAGAGWCSEFINVCAYDAGIDVGNVDYFPYFAGSQNGMNRLQEIGCLYAVTGTASAKTRAFQKVKTINTNTTDAFSVTLDTTAEAYVPQVGDVLFLGSTSKPTVPGHTALVCGVDKDDDEYSIYTVEGNLSLYDASGNAYEYKTVQRRKRDIWAVDSDGNAKSLGVRVLAVGRVQYPITYIDPSDTFQTQLNTGGSGGSDIEIDTTLTKSGAAADAKATGDALAKKANTTAIPTALKNPNALTFTGAVTGTYDGSAAKTINIPSGGGSGTTVVKSWYGECESSASTATKEVTVGDGFTLETGVSVFVSFQEQNSASNPKLSVNGTTAAYINLYGSQAVSGSSAWKEEEVVQFVYDGANWVMVDGAPASTTNRGAVALSSATNSSLETLAATPKAVSDALNAAKSYTDTKVAGGGSTGGSTINLLTTTATTNTGKLRNKEAGALETDANYDCTDIMAIPSGNTLIFLPELMVGGWIMFYTNTGTTTHIGSATEVSAACTVEIPAEAKYFSLTQPTGNPFYWACIKGGSVTLSSATDSTSETTAATSKAVSDALTTAKTYADNLIGGLENGTY